MLINFNTAFVSAKTMKENKLTNTPFIQSEFPTCAIDAICKVLDANRDEKR